MQKIEDRIIDIRKQTAECQRNISSEEQRIAVLSTEESDLHMQMHRLARQVIDDKKGLVRANEIDQGRKTNS